MLRTKPKQVKFWGEEYEVSNVVLDGKHGDGKNLMWFESMDNRPFLYYLYVDSSITGNRENRDSEIVLVESFVFEMIIEECGSTDQEGNEEAEFPVLCEATGGYSWGILPADYKLEL